LYERAAGNLVWGGRRPVALLGVDGVAVIDTDDALLIVQLERSGDLKRVVRRVAAEFGTKFL
jgi:hypothetical protein